MFSSRWLILLFVALLTALFCVNGDQSTTGSDIVLVDSKSDETAEAAKVGSIKFDADDVFVATHEWQTVKPNQAIPKGLHVRLNVQTGEREAKLLDETEANSNSKNDQQLTAEQEEKYKRMAENFKNSLKNLKPEDLVVDEARSDDENEAIKKKFRSYEEIKKELEKSDFYVKTDLESMKELIAAFVMSTKKEEKMNILMDFENYVHQVKIIY